MPVICLEVVTMEEFQGRMFELYSSFGKKYALALMMH